MSILIKNFTVKTLQQNHYPGQAKPFMRWAGGKQKMLGSLIERLPSPDSYCRYFEPFLGAGSVFLACGFKNAHLNDLNAQLVNSYNQVRDHPVGVYQLVKNYAGLLEKRGASYYYQIREEYNEKLEEYSLRQAARMIFLIQSNFNGIYRVNGSGHYNTPFGWKKTGIPDRENLILASQRLKGAVITTGHDTNLRNKIREGDFVYLDPPYPKFSHTAKFDHYTHDRFTEKDHRALAATALEYHKRGAKVMISIPLVPLVKECYPLNKPWNYYVTDVKRTISAKNPALIVKELILTNY